MRLENIANLGSAMENETIATKTNLTGLIQRLDSNVRDQMIFEVRPPRSIEHIPATHSSHEATRRIQDESDCR